MAMTAGQCLWVSDDLKKTKLSYCHSHGDLFSRQLKNSLCRQFCLQLFLVLEPKSACRQPSFVRDGHKGGDAIVIPWPWAVPWAGWHGQEDGKGRGYKARGTTWSLCLGLQAKLRFLPVPAQQRGCQLVFGGGDVVTGGRRGVLTVQTTTC